MVAAPFAESPSWAAATVTVCSVSQFELLNVSVFWSPGAFAPVSVSTVRSESPPTARVSVTLALGCTASFTVYVAVPPSGTRSVAGIPTTRSLSASVAVRSALAS